VLYLDRPTVGDDWCGISLLVGRFRYSDLKESALSEAGGLWELDRLELVVGALRLGVWVF
jgi:hypothetical protein